MRLKRMTIALMVVGALAGCSSPQFSGNAYYGGPATPTPSAKTATVTDVSAPLATSEADALVPRGMFGSAALGRLDIGCRVQVLKTTDRAAQVKVVSCPQPDARYGPDSKLQASVGITGWVARSALDL